MSQRLKSALYLLGFITAALLYNNEINSDETPQTIGIASTGIEQISAVDDMDE